MKIGLINGTPKFKDSASMVLMNDFKPYLAQNEIVEIEAHRNALSESQITMIRECPGVLLSIICGRHPFAPVELFEPVGNIIYPTPTTYSCLRRLQQWFL